MVLHRVLHRVAYQLNVVHSIRTGQTCINTIYTETTLAFFSEVPLNISQ